MLRRQQRVLSSATASACSTAFDNRGSCPSPAGPHPVEEIPIHLKPSRSAHRKASFYIPRMRETQPDAHAFRVSDLGSAVPLFAITSSSCEYFALRLPLLKAGFKRLPLTGGDVGTACNVVWGKSPRFARDPAQHSLATDRIVYMQTPPSLSVTRAAGASPDASSAVPPDANAGTIALNNPFQKFNHFPGSHKTLGCKRGMAKNIMHTQRVMRQLSATAGVEQRTAVQDMYAFSPRTWFYPENKAEMVQAFRAASPSSHFIWKPARGSCGRGILLSQGGAAHEHSWESVMREIEHRVRSDALSRVYRQYVVQEYVENPLLLEGRKMDLRLYVTVTSFNPLTVYLHEEGLVRLAAEPYHEGTETTPALDTNCSVVPHEQQHEPSAMPTGSTSPLSLSFDAFMGRSTPPTRPASPQDLASGRFRHLTNFSVGRRYQAHRQQQQQQQQQRVHHQSLAPSVGVAAASMSDDASNEISGEPDTPSGPELKWSLQRLWAYLDAQPAGAAAGAANGMAKPSVPSSSDSVKEKIALLITRTLLAARPNLCKAAAAAETRCGYFELYGFDVMLDEKLDPFLIEINTLPSLESSSDFDYATKCNVISDMLNVAMIEPFARDPSTLLSFTTHSAILQPPSAALTRFVRGVGESVVSLAQLPTPAQAEEIKARLQDELLYARGFKRIFPPMPAPVGSQDYPRHAFPLTNDMTSVKSDIATFAAFGMLTPLDELAMSN